MTDPSRKSQDTVTKNSDAIPKIVVSMDNVLNRVILIIAIVTGFGLIATLLLYQRKLGSFLFILALATTMILAKLLMRNGHARPAALCAIIGIWFSLVVFLFLGGGLDNINIVFLVSTTVWAGLLLGERATIWVASASCAAGLGLALMAMYGWLPSPYFLHSPLTDWIQFVFALILTAGTLNIALSDRDNALDIANKQFSDRLETEKALRESEIRNRSFLEAIPDIMFIFDRAGIYLDYHATDKNLLAVEPEQFLGKSVSEILPVALAQRILHCFEKAQETKQTQVLEYSLDVQSGQKHFEVRVTPMDDQRQLTIVRDISERKRVEEALKESESNYRQLFENSPVAIYRIDFKSGKILKANDVFCEHTGYSREELASRSPIEFLTEASRVVFLERLEKMGRGETVPQTVEYEIIDKTGTHRWIHLHNKNIYNAEGHIVASDVVAHEITERKQAVDALRTSEERYRTIFEGTATANIIVAEDTTIRMANQKFSDLVGYSQQEMQGKISWTEFVLPEDLERVKNNQRMRAIDPESVPPSYELRAITKKGEIKDLFMSVAVIPKTRESVVSLIDLTEMKQLETQLTQAQKIESVGRLAGGVAHDFNNMLSVIIGNTEMAMNRVKHSEPLYQTLQQIMNAGMRSADLTRQLLAFARKQTISPKVLDLNDTVTGMLKMLQRLIGENIDLAWHPGHNLWKVRIDPSQIDQLLANLAVNGRDAIDKAGQIVIETSNMPCDEAFCAGRLECIPGEYVMLAVSDTGHGMEKEILANIFEPFFTTKKEGQGTGLGLATVYGVVKQNGGFIDVHSTPGQGTTFRIYLPRHLDESMEITDDKPFRKIQGGTETILIVEDEESVLSLSTEMLEGLGYKVLAASKADQAIRLVREYRGNIDLLLTDVVMPDMNGRDMSDRIGAIRPGLRCLYMSGYTSEVIASQGILDEGIQFIAKPFHLRDLASKVREVLGQ